MSQTQRPFILRTLIVSLVLPLLAGCQLLQPPLHQLDASQTQRAGEQASGIRATTSDKVDPAFDLVYAVVQREGPRLVFQIMVAGEAGAVIPAATGELAGATVESYVWPTSLNSSAVGFAADQGILALAVTAHPDFDDTPLVDEDQDGDKANDGKYWHSHWVVLVPDEACGADALKVKDIAEGEQPALPVTWPELPLLIDSPNYELMVNGATIEAYVPLDRLAGVQTFNYDGVTAGLQVNANLHAPLLCVTTVHDVASGDLNLPGRVE